MNPLDNLSVCITNFGRPEFLERAILSCKAAGIHRLTICSVSPTKEVYEVIDRHQRGWTSYDVTRIDRDIGCNDTWMLAAMMSRTDRVVILHDDDVLHPDFYAAYGTIISPELDRGGLIASWRASLIFNDKTTKATEYFHGPTRRIHSNNLRRIVGTRGRLSLSPIVSVLDRDTVIAACKEADWNLSRIPECIHRPGMLLGTEIVVYLRHCDKFPQWLYVDQILAHYGSHEGSGTIQAEQTDNISRLARGYDHARTLCETPAK